MFVLNFLGIGPALRLRRLHDAETLVCAICVLDRPSEVVPVGLTSFVYHSALHLFAVDLPLILAALRPSAQPSILTRCCGLTLRFRGATTDRTVTNKRDTVDRASHRI